LPQSEARWRAILDERQQVEEYELPKKEAAKIPEG
jgi:hypothetical protein